MDMSVKKLTSESERFNKEEQVLYYIRSGASNVATVNWFFENARLYAQKYLIKDYPNIDKPEWDVIFANVNLKFITRIKNGMELRPETRLATYYTSIAKFAVLDFVRDRKAHHQYQFIQEQQAVEPPLIERKMEREERAREIEAWLFRIVENKDQVKVLLLQAEGWAYKDILLQTDYQSEGACRNALLKGKKKIAEYLIKYPEVARSLKKLLQDN